MKGFGVPVHQKKGYRRYWVNCLYQGEEWWMSLWVRKTGGPIVQDDDLARAHCIAYFSRNQIDELFIFPDAPSPEKVGWVLDHLQNQPFAAVGEAAIEADVNKHMRLLHEH